MLREAAALPGPGTYATAALGYVLAAGGTRPRRKHCSASSGGSHLRAMSPRCVRRRSDGLGNADARSSGRESYEERRGWLVYLTVNPCSIAEGNGRFEALIFAWG